MGQVISSVFAGCFAILVAGAGLAALVWLLWRLWSHRDQEQVAPAQPLPAAGQAGVVEAVAVPQVVEEPPVVVRVPAIELGLQVPPEDLAAEEPALEAPPEDVAAQEPALEAPPEDVAAQEPALEALHEGVAAQELALGAPPEDVEGQEPALETRTSGAEAAALSAEPGVDAPPPAEPSPPATRGPEDLTVIEGIGPKISGILHAAGVATFSDLAALEPEQVRQILADADPRLLRLADPATWPRQAGLAAAGKWDELKALQERLSGGQEG